MPKCSLLFLALLLYISSAAAAQQTPWTVTTIAGNGSAADTGSAGKATEVSIGQPFGVTVAGQGTLLVTEVENHRVWKVDLFSGKARVIVGCGQKGYSGDGGPACDAQLNEPYEVRCDRAGNLYLVEMKNHLIRRVDAKTGNVSTVAGTGQPGFSGDGGPATAAMLNQPHSLVLDEKRNQIYVADIGNHRIRAIDLKDGTIRTLAGNGERQLPQPGPTGPDHSLLGPRALALAQDRLWIALREGHSLWYLDLQTNTLHGCAGDGKAGFQAGQVPANQARFNGPKGIALTPDGQVVIVDTENHAIRLYDPNSKTVSTLAGEGPQDGGFLDGSTPHPSRFDRPHGVAVDAEGNIYVGDTLNHRVRCIHAPNP